MRANYRMQRLYIENGLAAGTSVEAEAHAAHYLSHVLRLKEGDEILTRGIEAATAGRVVGERISR